MKIPLRLFLHLKPSTFCIACRLGVSKMKMVQFLCFTDYTGNIILIPFIRKCLEIAPALRFLRLKGWNTFKISIPDLKSLSSKWREQIREVLVKLLHGISSCHFDNEVLGIANRVTSFSFWFPLKYVDLQFSFEICWFTTRNSTPANYFYRNYG